MNPLTWTERPQEAANLLNPAFLGQLIERAATGHKERVGVGLPWPLVFLALPAVLHKPTREAFPRDTRTAMGAWTRAHPLLVATVADRAQTLRPLVAEALFFSLRHSMVRLHDSSLTPPASTSRRRPRGQRPPTDDFRGCATRASFYGRWCGDAGSPATIFALWGVRP